MAKSAGMACEDLAGLSLPNTTITSAEFTLAGSYGPPGPSQIVVPVDICWVVGYVDTEINFGVWMPVAESWNSKFNGVGNGGLAGFINHGAMTDAAERGYATASTDTGHVGDPSAVNSARIAF